MFPAALIIAFASLSVVVKSWNPASNQTSRHLAFPDRPKSRPGFISDSLAKRMAGFDANAVFHVPALRAAACSLNVGIASIPII